MKANELRLGNYVMYNDMVMRVSEILSPKRREDERYNNKYVIELFEGEGLIDATLDEIKPIPLTIEFLLKFAAKSRFENTEFIYDRFRLIWKESYGYWYVIDTDSIAYITKVEFVHEWQNLIFILNGEELKFES